MKREKSRILKGIGLAFGATTLWVCWMCFASRTIVVSEHEIILCAGAAKPLAEQCSRDSPLGSFYAWPVRSREVLEVQAALPALLQKQNWKLSDFNFQHAALRRGGERLIYVNAFPTNMSYDEWQEKAVSVCDGGPMFWGAEYDVSEKKFVNASFNVGPF